jgi:chaperonin cofactor prefoldin
MILFIIEETKKNKQAFVKDEKELMEIRKTMVENQKKEMRKHLEGLKKSYENLNVPKSVLKNLDDALSKVDSIGIRVKQ